MRCARAATDQASTISRTLVIWQVTSDTLSMPTLKKEPLGDARPSVAEFEFDDDDDDDEALLDFEPPT